MLGEKLYSVHVNLKSWKSRDTPSQFRHWLHIVLGLQYIVVPLNINRYRRPPLRYGSLHQINSGFNLTRYRYFPHGDRPVSHHAGKCQHAIVE
jgi:hypothetical protein